MDSQKQLELTALLELQIEEAIKPLIENFSKEVELSMTSVNVSLYAVNTIGSLPYNKLGGVTVRVEPWRCQQNKARTAAAKMLKRGKTNGTD